MIFSSSSIFRVVVVILVSHAYRSVPKQKSRTHTPLRDSRRVHKWWINAPFELKFSKTNIERWAYSGILPLTVALSPRVFHICNWHLFQHFWYVRNAFLHADDIESNERLNAFSFQICLVSKNEMCMSEYNDNFHGNLCQINNCFAGSIHFEQRK